MPNESNEPDRNVADDLSDGRRPIPSPERRFSVVGIAMAVFAVLVVAVGVYAFFVVDGVRHSHGSADDTVFSVAEGEDARELAARLEEEGIIRSDTSLLYYLFRNADLRRRMQAGDYLVSGEMTIPEIVDLFVSGETYEYGVRVTFPEGFTAEQMAVRLSERGLPGDAFLDIVRSPDAELMREYPFLSDIPAGNDLEGVLFPDTYVFDPEAGAEGVVRKMLDGFEAKAWALLSGTGEGWYDALVLASILETEVRTTEDRKAVADLFLRRMEAGMALQSDATVRYALGETKVKHSLSDLAIDSPYNSYRYPGLPPGPVSNPGTDAIGAALHPIPNPYWYFLSNPETGETVFSVTFEEHVANKGRNGL